MKPTREQVLAEPAGRQMDAWVAEYVLGTPFVKPGHGPCCTCQVCGQGHDDCLCGLSDDIAAAWQVVERMMSGGPSEAWQLMRFLAALPDKAMFFTQQAHHAARAISVAALLAVIEGGTA